MGYVKQGEIADVRKRIKPVLKRLTNGERSRYGCDDAELFQYVMEQTEPKRLKQREEAEDTNMHNLVAVAYMRLRPYEESEARRNESE